MSLQQPDPPADALWHAKPGWRSPLLNFTISFSSFQECRGALMKPICRGVAALLVWAAFTTPGWSQRGIPVPRPAPHPMPVHPVVPHHGSQRGGNAAIDPTLLIGGIVAGAAALGGLLVGVRAWRNRTVGHLRIVRTPPGEAPEEI